MTAERLGRRSMFHSVRLASAGVRYPLTLHGPARWRPGSAPIRVPLPDVPPDHVIAASFASNEAAAFSFSLAAGRGKRAETARFGARTRRREASGNDGIAVPVDYFHTRTALPRPMLSLRCACPARPPPPPEHLLSVSIRPRVIAPPPTSPPMWPPRPPLQCQNYWTSTRACVPLPNP